jgi:myosin-5
MLMHNIHILDCSLPSKNGFFCVMSSFQEKVTTMEAENQLLRQQALLRTPVRTIPENASPKSVCCLSIPHVLEAF